MNLMTKYFTFLTLIVFAAGCAKGILVEPISEQVKFAGSQKQTVKLIKEAAEKKGWRIKQGEKDTLIGILNVRSHRVKVKIKYTEKSVTVSYVDSDNMRYDGERIHKKYAQWVRNLLLEIRKLSD